MYANLVASGSASGLYGSIFLPSLVSNFVDLSDLYVALSDPFVNLSLIHLLENKSYKRVLGQLVPYR